MDAISDARKYCNNDLLDVLYLCNGKKRTFGNENKCWQVDSKEFDDILNILIDNNLVQL